MGEIERIHIGLVRKVAVGAALVSVAAVLGAAAYSRPLALGVALGGGFILALFGLYRVLAGFMFAAATPRRGRALFWVVWALKWPVLCAALYFAFRTGVATPVGVALGAGILPTVAVLIVLRAVLVDAWRNLHGGIRAS